MILWKKNLKQFEHVVERNIRLLNYLVMVSLLPGLKLSQLTSIILAVHMEMNIPYINVLNINLKRKYCYEISHLCLDH